MSDFLFKLRILWMLLRCTYSEWRREVWVRNLDSPYCCDGRECGCYGTTVRELYARRKLEQRP